MFRGLANLDVMMIAVERLTRIKLTQQLSVHWQPLWPAGSEAGRSMMSLRVVKLPVGHGHL
jgi:hypothetical protein